MSPAICKAFSAMSRAPRSVLRSKASAAAWAVAEIGQDDELTLGMLVARVLQVQDPLWLRADAVGALAFLVIALIGFGAGLSWGAGLLRL